MMNSFLFPTNATVTISVKEYRDLVERGAYLNIITDFAQEGQTYLLDDVARSVKKLLTKAVITGNEPEKEETPQK